MKFKSTEEKNYFLDNIIELLTIIDEYWYAIESFNKDISCNVINAITSDKRRLMKLAISLNPKHIYPEYTINRKPALSLDDLINFEEKYYSKLVEVGNKALEENNIEVVSCISMSICNFEHYFCTLKDEGNV